MEFTCRRESIDQAAVLRTAFPVNRLHPGGQVQRFVMFPLALVLFLLVGILSILEGEDINVLFLGINSIEQPIVSDPVSED